MTHARRQVHLWTTQHWWSKCGTVLVSDTPTDQSMPRVRIIEEEFDAHTLLSALAELAPRMNSRKRRWWAFKQYDGLAGAIWWSDEMLLWPRPKGDEDDALRCVVRFRTTLILGEPDESLRPFWTAAQAMFPNWIGFAPDRTTPKPKLIAYYHRMHEAFDREFVQPFVAYLTEEADSAPAGRRDSRADD